MISRDIKNITDVLHLVYCGRIHEEDMQKLYKTKNCQYYLDESLENSWTELEHNEWIGQAKFFISLCKPLDYKEVIRNIADIWRVVERFKEVNVRLVDYLRLIISDGGN